MQVPAETLRDLALNDPSVDVRILAMDSLAAMNDPILRDIAEQALNDSNHFIHDKAEEILQGLKGESQQAPQQRPSNPRNPETTPPQPNM